MKLKTIKPRKCKNCLEVFAPSNMLVPVCSMNCAIAYSKLLKINKDKKELNDKCKVWKVDTHASQNKSALQAQINLLARKIDACFDYDCIDLCGKSYGKQIDGCHLHSVGSNSSLRYNLHNIHSGRSDCNKHSNLHHEGYKKGLVARYGIYYATMVEGLPLRYKSIHLSNVEIADKLKIVRNITRNFSTFKFESSIEARNLFNNILKIYK